MSNETKNPKILKVEQLIREMGKVVIGYEDIKRQLVVALLADGHVLLEGMPGLAKTQIIKALQACFTDATAGRIQMTPDLKPSDVIGVYIFNPKTAEFEFQPGPVVGVNFMLADEVNRTPPKTQSALLQAMEERFISVGRETIKMEDPFLVLATMNPVEQEGTFPLPEAQLDRFMFKLLMGYVSRKDEVKVLGNVLSHGRRAMELIEPCISRVDITSAREEVFAIAENASEELREYIVDLMRATRPSDATFKSVKDAKGADFSDRIMHGCSVRLSIWVQRGAAVNAWLDGRDYITPDDVKKTFRDCTRHRLILTQEAVFESFQPDVFISALLNTVPIAGRKQK